MDPADKKDVGANDPSSNAETNTDKGRSSKRSKEDRKAKERARNRHTDSSGMISLERTWCLY